MRVCLRGKYKIKLTEYRKQGKFHRAKVSCFFCGFKANCGKFSC